MQGVSGTSKTIGLLKAAASGVTNSFGSALMAVRSTAGLTATTGIVVPNPGKKTTDVLGGQSTTASITIPVIGPVGLTLEVGGNSNGKYFGYGIGTAGASLTTTNGSVIQRARH